MPTNSRRGPGPVLFAAALVAAAVATGAGISAAVHGADAPQQPKRNILERHDQSGVEGYEVVLGTAQLAAGTTIDWHTHHGDETGYVVSGNLVLRVKDKPDRVLAAGDYFFNPAGLVHSVVAAPGTDGGTIVSTWVVQKGKPLAEPAG